MKTARLIFQREAEKDVRAIALYLAGDSPKAAERFFVALEGLCKLLKDTPHIGSTRIFQSPRLKEVRTIPLKDLEKHLVFYRFVDNTIEILRVIHGARDYPLLFQ